MYIELSFLASSGGSTLRQREGEREKEREEEGGGVADPQRFISRANVDADRRIALPFVRYLVKV